MRKIGFICLLAATFVLGSCNSLKNLASGFLTEGEAVNALREALIMGSNNGALSLGQRGSFSRDVLLNAILPQDVQRVVQALDRLGLASELNRFTNTLDNAAVESVKRSAPIFITGIRQMSFRDAIGIVKNGGTAATDYLRRSVGDSLRGAIRPVMRTALEQYRIAQEWDKLIGPVKLLLGDRAGLNLNLENVMAVMITNEMFKKIEEQEVSIRTNASARTTASLQRVFGRDWNASNTRY